LRGHGVLCRVASHPHNLPTQLTSFIGCEREITEIKRLLGTTRLLTLTGSGGCGKTRLAIQVAADLLEQYPDGVWLVELAPLSDPSLVPQAAADTLGIRDQPGQPVQTPLQDYLQSRCALLVVDNCEHVIEACASLIQMLLRTCPSLRVLATSREALNTAGESAWRVPSLPVPDPAYLPSVEELTDIAAIRLFVERAAAVVPTFALTSQNAPAIVQICNRPASLFRVSTARGTREYGLRTPARSSRGVPSVVFPATPVALPSFRMTRDDAILELTPPQHAAGSRHWQLCEVGGSPAVPISAVIFRPFGTAEMRLSAGFGLLWAASRPLRVGGSEF